MDTPTILKNLDNGTITRDAAIELLVEHSHPRYVIGAYLETRRQRDAWREELYALQDETERPRLQQGTVINLIDHALDTDHITPDKAEQLLHRAGMDAETINHHVETILAIRDRDMERVAYLVDPDNAPCWCTRCGRKMIAGQVSNRGICVECSSAAVEENLIGLHTKTGPAYTRWRNAMLVFAYTLKDAEIAERHVKDPPDLGNLPDPFHVLVHTHPNLDTVPITDLIDRDKYPGCDAECDLCPDTDCPFRDTLADTG